MGLQFLAGYHRSLVCIGAEEDLVPKKKKGPQGIFWHTTPVREVVGFGRVKVNTIEPIEHELGEKND